MKNAGAKMIHRPNLPLCKPFRAFSAPECVQTGQFWPNRREFQQPALTSHGILSMIKIMLGMVYVS